MQPQGVPAESQAKQYLVLASCQTQARSRHPTVSPVKTEATLSMWGSESLSTWGPFKTNREATPKFKCLQGQVSNECGISGPQFGTYVFYVGHRQDLGPCVLYCPFTTNSKVWDPKQSSYILTVNYLNLKCLHACTISEGNFTPLLYWKRKKNLMTKLIIIHSYFSVICVWVLD